MYLEKRDEVKRTKLYRAVTSTASVLIIVVVGYFLIRMFAGNPLEGTWVSEDSDLVFSIKNSSTVTVNVPEVGEDTNVKVKLEYALDKDEKLLTFKKDQDSLEKVAKASDGQYDADTLETALSSILTTFDYSVDGDELTLTEREYGEQMLFTKE